MERLIDTHEAFFRLLDAYADINVITNEKHWKRHRNFSISEKKRFGYLRHLLEEFVFEGELYIIPEYDLKMVEEYFGAIYLFHGIVHVPK